MPTGRSGYTIAYTHKCLKLLPLLYMFYILALDSLILTNVFMQLVDLKKANLWKQSIFTNPVWISGIQLPLWKHVNPITVLLFWKTLSTLYGWQYPIAAVNNSIVIYLIQVGGCDKYTVFETVDRYDPDTKQWRPMTSMSTKRSYVGVGVLNGLLYAVNCEKENKCRNGLILTFLFFSFL